MQYVYSFVCFLSIFIIAVVQLLCVIVCRALVNKDGYIMMLDLMEHIDMPICAPI